MADNRNKNRPPSIKDRVYEALVRQPHLRRQSNSYIANHLSIKNPLSVSQAFSALHHDGKIRVHYSGELHPVRHIDIL